jgi:hypothetical protein
MAHARRKIAVSTSATTNLKKNLKHYGTKTVKYDYPRDDVSLTNQALNAAAKEYRVWLKEQVAEPTEMSFVTLSQSHKIQYD